MLLSRECNSCTLTYESTAEAALALGNVPARHNTRCMLCKHLSIGGCAIQGEHDRPGALASCFHWALFCWNHEEAQKRSSQGTPDWAAILVCPETQLI